MAAHDDIQLVSIPTDGVRLEGELGLPDDPRGIVLFAHGSGSSRHSSRNRYVARSLRAEAHVGTLLFDLLSEGEEQEDLGTGELRFDVPLLASRLEAATAWARNDCAATSTLPLAYFGASTGAAAALVAAAHRPNDVVAVVSRGGRPDLAGHEALERVRAPTLLLVGGEDAPVIEMNRQALAHLGGKSDLEVVAGASHLFEEPGALEQVARKAVAWLASVLPPGSGARTAPAATPQH
jgi:dienelactone hydrolase